MKKYIAYIIAPIIWIVTGILHSLLIISVWGFSPDKYATIALIAYLGAAIGVWLAHEAANKIYPDISAKGIYLWVAIFGFVWVILSVLSAHNDTELSYRVVGLIASQIGFLTAWIQNGRKN